MKINTLTPDYAVSPQITVEDVAQLKDAGFGTVICNRPDHEVQSRYQADAIRSAVEAAGLSFVDNPVEAGEMTQANVDTQRAAVVGAQAPVFAYCRSGNRSAVVWALALAGDVPVADILKATQDVGYDLSGLRQYLEAAAESR